MSSAKYWVFTLNNYTLEDKENLNKLVNEKKVAFIGYGEEIGESGTPHLQGHLELQKRVRLSTLKRLLGQRFHLEVRKGSFEQADDYCQKDGVYTSLGDRVSKGKGYRSDLNELRLALVDGMPLQEISNEFFSTYIRYRRSIVAFKNLNAQQRTWQSSVIIYWGKTGTGKTRSVYDNAVNMQDVWVYPGNGWFDGYNGQPIALFDDFSGSEFKLPYLLKLLDRYPMQVPIKGDFVSWVPKEIYITSNLDPAHWFPNAHHEHVQALFRRVTNKVHFA